MREGEGRQALRFVDFLASCVISVYRCSSLGTTFRININYLITSSFRRAGTVSPTYKSPKKESNILPDADIKGIKRPYVKIEKWPPEIFPRGEDKTRSYFVHKNNSHANNARNDNY